MTDSEIGLRFSTTDHKPTNEKDRILKSGHNVVSGRIDCSLSVSRAFGDFRYKSNLELLPAEQAVISVPEISKIRKSEKDEFLILG